MTLSVEKEKIYQELTREVGWIKIYWSEYFELFIRSDNNYDSIDSVPFFFNKIVQPSLCYWIILSIIRLFDQPKSCGKENLVFQSIIEGEDDGLFKELKESKEVVAMIEWRNKFLSHNDFKTIMDNINLHKNHTILHKDIETVITKIEDLLADISSKNGYQVNFPIKPFGGTAKSLLKLINKANQLK
jgi:hypothetical protein